MCATARQSAPQRVKARHSAMLVYWRNNVWIMKATREELQIQVPSSNTTLRTFNSGHYLPAKKCLKLCFSSVFRILWAG